MAEAWNNDDALRDISPAYVSSLAPNAEEGVPLADFEKLRTRYLQILNTYQEHSEWVILKEFLKECIDPWKNRPIMEAEGEIPLATCRPGAPTLCSGAKVPCGGWE